MTRGDIENVIGDRRDWQVASPNARDAFVKEMQFCQYGHGPLTSAWDWFNFGWCARVQTAL